MPTWSGVVSGLARDNAGSVPRSDCPPARSLQILCPPDRRLVRLPDLPLPPTRYSDNTSLVLTNYLLELLNRLLDDAIDYDQERSHYRLLICDACALSLIAFDAEHPPTQPKVPPHQALPLLVRESQQDDCRANAAADRTYSQRVVAEAEHGQIRDHACSSEAKQRRSLQTTSMSVVVGSMPHDHHSGLPLRPIEAAVEGAHIVRNAAADSASNPPKPSDVAAPSARGTARTRPLPEWKDLPRGAYRAQSLQLIREANGDVDAFLEELELKRRQLDDQIQRYMKSREREMLSYEKNLRTKYRADDLLRTSERDSLADQSEGRDGRVGASGSLEETSAVESQQRSRSLPHKDDNGLTDSNVSAERQGVLIGLFTPQYLPMLERTDGTYGDEPSSAPVTPSPLQDLKVAVPHSPVLTRSSSDPIDSTDRARSERSLLTSRTSSSGSEGKNLISALKSSTTPHRLPKRKRVSIVVGDEVVAPSDSVPDVAALTFESDPRVVGADEPSIPARRSMGTLSHTVRSSSDLVLSHGADPRSQSLFPSGIASGLAQERLAQYQQQAAAGAPSDDSPHNEPDDPEVFDLSDIDDENASTEGAANIDDALYQPETDDISGPESPSDGEQSKSSLSESQTIASAVSPLAILRRSSSSSFGQASPGFARPSAKDDSFFGALATDAIPPEIADNQTFGSIASSYSFLDKTGSLGESYMERNAEELRLTGRRRTSISSQRSE